MARDHYVQQKLQIGFVNKEGAFHLFDKKVERRGYPVHPANVLFEKDYEAPALAELLKAIENCGMEGIELIRRGHYHALTSEMFEGIMLYLRTHLKRSPHHFHEPGVRTPEDRELVYLTEMPHLIFHSGNISFRPVVFRPSAVPLYLTDNPVCVLRVGEEQALITFPIASRLMIAGICPSPEIEGDGQAWHPNPWRPPDHMAERINTALFRRAARFVLCEHEITPPID